MQEESDIKTQISDLLKDLKRRFNLTQESVAEKLGVERETVNRSRSSQVLAALRLLLRVLELEEETLPWKTESDRIHAERLAELAKMPVKTFAVDCVKRYGGRLIDDLHSQIQTDRVHFRDASSNAAGSNVCSNSESAFRKSKISSTPEPAADVKKRQPAKPKGKPPGE